MNINEIYHDILKTILESGVKYQDPRRKGVIRTQIPYYNFTYEFKNGFPAITTKKLAIKSIITELIWFMRGDTSIEYLLDNNCNIWNKDAYNYYVKHAQQGRHGAWLSYEEFITEIKGENEDELGQLGPVYGAQWRAFDGKDQLKDIVNKMINEPMRTDIMLNSWNVAELDMMALEPCHFGLQIMMKPMYFDENKNKTQYGFYLVWSQRSVDTFLGLPFNIASYGVLAHILGELTDSVPLGIIGDLRNVHLYDNSISAVKEQLERSVNKYSAGKLKYNLPMDIYKGTGDIDDVIYRLDKDMFSLPDYNSYGPLKVPMLGRDE
jgi:thymidylate synthase